MRKVRKDGKQAQGGVEAMVRAEPLLNSHMERFPSFSYRSLSSAEQNTSAFWRDAKLLDLDRALRSALPHILQSCTPRAWLRDCLPCSGPHVWHFLPRDGCRH